MRIKFSCRIKYEWIIKCRYRDLVLIARGVDHVVGKNIEMAVAFERHRHFPSLGAAGASVSSSKNSKPS